jgi:pimeloyl-ACP methyl ester carboxylesterase
MRLLLALLLTLPSFPALSQVATPPSAVVADPAENKANPAAMEQLVISSHGSNMNGLIYLAAGPGPHPTVILLHGFPGYEQNLDLAQSIRRAGWNVLFFHYRGSWGSQGSFSFANSLADTQTAIDWIRDPQNAKKYHMDSSRIVLIGHSMGGFMASAGGAKDKDVMAVGMIAAWNLGSDAKRMKDVPARTRTMSAQIYPLAGCTAESLIAEMKAHVDDWNYNTFVPQLKNRPALVISANDGLHADNDSFVAAMKTAGAQRVTSQHVDTDHVFSDHRIALQSIVIDWLKGLNP